MSFCFSLPSLIFNKTAELCTQTDHKHAHRIISGGISFETKAEGANILSYIRQV